MGLPPLVSLEDLRDEVDDEAVMTSKRAGRVLARASTRVRSVVGRTYVDDTGNLVEPIPDPVTETVLAAAARAWRNPRGVIQDTTGPFTVRYSEKAADGVYLTEEEREDLERLRPTGGLWTLPTTSCDPYLDEVALDVVSPLPLLGL